MIKNQNLLLTVILICSTVFADLSSDNIENVLVSASMIPININQTSKSVDIIDSSELASSIATDITDLLRNIPGLAVSQTGSPGSQTQIRLRGSEANHILVTIDGIEANNAGQNDEFTWGTLSPNDIERIEIIKGPQSTLYGSDAMAGVINIITKLPNKPLELNAYSDIASFQTTNTGVNFGMQRERGSYQVGVSNLGSNGANISRSGKERDGYENTNLNIKSYFILNNQITIHGKAHRTFGFSEYDADFDFDSIIDDADMHARFKTDIAGIEVGYSPIYSKWNHKLFVNDAEHSNQDYADDIIDISTTSKKRQLRFISSFELNNPINRFSVLFEKEDEDYSQKGPVNDFGEFGIFDPNYDSKRDVKSIAAEYRSQIKENLLLALSKRHEKSSAFKNSETYTVEVSYSLNEMNKIRVLYGTSTKNPTFTELFGFYTNFVGNPDLIPEEALGWELSLDTSMLNRSVESSISIFHSDLINEIDGNFIDPVSLRYTAINKFGKSKRQGMEWSTLVKINNDLEMNWSYTYTDSKQPKMLENYERELRRPRNLGSLRVSWKKFNKLDLRAEIQYNGSQLDFAYPDRISMPSFTVANLSTVYFFNDNLDIYFRFDNLLNEKYEEVFSYKAQGMSAKLGVRIRL